MRKKVVTLTLLVVVVKRENNSKFQRKFDRTFSNKKGNFVFGGGRIINKSNCKLFMAENLHVIIGYIYKYTYALSRIHFTVLLIYRIYSIT